MLTFFYFLFFLFLFLFYFFFFFFPFLILFLIIALLLLNHGLWFWFFRENYLPFAQILSIFFLCVWLVPFAFFVSLSANENTLPYANTSIASMFDGVREERGEEEEGGARRERNEGGRGSPYSFSLAIN